MIVYRATDLINDKVYIGQTILTLEERIKDHLKRSRYPKYKIHKALQKHGFNNFIWQILKRCKNKNELTKWEQYYIDRNNSFYPNGYNVAPAGNSIKHSKKTKQKLAELIRGKSYIERFGLEKTKDILNRKSESMKGKNRYPKSEEVKKKISRTRIEKGIAKGIKNPMYGKHFSKEHRNKISNALKGKMVGSHHWNFGKHHSNETKEKIRLARLGKKASEETKLKQSISRKKYLSSLK